MASVNSLARPGAALAFAVLGSAILRTFSNSICRSLQILKFVTTHDGPKRRQAEALQGAASARIGHDTSMILYCLELC